MKTLIKPITITPLDQVSHLRHVISAESVSNEGIIHSLKELMPSLVEHFKGFVHGFLPDGPAIDLKASEVDFMKSIANQPYLNLAPLAAHIPEGMIATYLDYLQVLQDVAKHCEATALANLNEYSLYLAQIITNRELRLTGVDHEAKNQRLEKTRSVLRERMAACFKTGSSKATSTYGEVVQRNADWRDVFAALAATSKEINQINRSHLHKKAEECSNQLALIIKQIKDGKFEGAGPEVTTNLASGAYQAGAELELFTIAYFRIAALNTAISDTVNDINKILKFA